MPRWKALASQHLWWSSPVARGLVLCIVTFGIVLPLCCHRLLYCYYYIKSMYLNDMSDEFLAESYKRGNFTTWDAAREQWKNQAHVNTFEREKRDYVYCLRKGWELARPKNLMVLEDEALPGADFFAVIRDLLSRRFALHTLYVKLYHPERLQRYWNPEPYRILEWVGLGLVGANTLLLTLTHCTLFSFSFSTTHLLFLTLYIMVAVELACRHYLLEARRFSPQFYAVSPATECCTPAMLFPGNSSLGAAEYLDGSFCVKGNAKDTVLYQMARTITGERAHSLEPNLVSHIGAFSSVRANPSRPRLL
uniref:Post-GPI attachment to proteins GalNAc transferase 4 n=1 Tax=Hucho hucho TaxID=62062 RepID=A0A4W5M691_9TELE